MKRRRKKLSYGVGNCHGYIGTFKIYKEAYRQVPNIGLDIYRVYAYKESGTVKDWGRPRNCELLFRCVRAKIKKVVPLSSILRNNISQFCY